MQTINFKQRTILGLSLAASALLACNSRQESVTISDSQTIESAEASSASAMDDATRFGYQKTNPSSSSGVPATMASTPAFEYSLPEGWREIAPTSLRSPNFAIDGAPGIEAYITVLPGAAGGALSNYNRWRNQMVGMEPLEDLSSLSQIKVMDQMVPLLDIQGAFTGMGNAAQENYRLLGLAVPMGQSMVFIKMTGPADEIVNEATHFVEFLSSLHAGGEDHTGHNHAEMPSDAIHGGMPDDAIHAGMPSDATHAGAIGTMPDVIQLSGGPIDPNQLSWTAPEGWAEASGSAMRLANFNVGPNGEANCAVFVFKGTAGGVDSNINRWRAQMGLQALTADELKALEKIEMLGREAIIVEIEGKLNDTMSGTNIDDAKMLGLVCSLGDQTMFIKMSGPRALMSGQKDNFVLFCQSFVVK